MSFSVCNRLSLCVSVTVSKTVIVCFSVCHRLSLCVSMTVSKTVFVCFSDYLKDYHCVFQCLSQTVIVSFSVCHRRSLCVSVSVTHIEWFDEDKKFAVAFTDGVIYMCLKNMEAPVVIEAHQVS